MTSRPVYKGGVIGVGGRGSGWARQLHAHKEVELVAVCDYNEGRAKSVAEKCGGVKAYKNYQEMIDKEDLDFVITATPHYLHAPITVYACENDVHMLTEKPMCTTLQDADRMIIAARKNCVKLGVGFQHRFNPIYDYLYNAVRGEEGDLGSLGRITDLILWARHFRSGIYYLSSSPVDPTTAPPGPWRGRWATEGGGILANQAIHDIDFFQYIVGKFRSLSAHANTIAKDHALIEVEDTVTVSFETEYGALGTMVFSTANKKSPQNRIIVQGENGYVEKLGGFITHDDRWKDEEDWPVPFTTPPRHNVLENFLDAITNDTDPLIPGEEGRKSVEIMRAIFKSVQEERLVYFPVKDTITFPTLHNLNRDEPLSDEDLL